MTSLSDTSILLGAKAGFEPVPEPRNSNTKFDLLETNPVGVFYTVYHDGYMASKDLFQRHPVFLHFLVEKGSMNPQKHRCPGFVTVLTGEGVAKGIPLSP